MKQLEDDVYDKLVKDANDNKQIMKIFYIGAFLILFFTFFFSWGKGLIDLDIQKRTAELECQIALNKAKTNADILKIEKGDMNMDEYIKWVAARSD